MKILFVVRRVAGPDGPEVTCSAQVAGIPGQGVPVRHLVRHSPTGFEFGYGGSGPADLARSIVGHLMADDDPQPVDYQAVKDRFVATLPHDDDGPHVLDADQIITFLVDQAKRRTRTAEGEKDG